MCDLHSSWSTDSVVNSHPPNPSLFAFPTLFGLIVWMSFYQSSKVNHCLVFPSLTLSSYPACVFWSFLEPCSLARVCSCSVFVSFFPWIILTFYWQLTKPFGALTILYAPWSFVFVHTIGGIHKYKYTQTQWQIQPHKNTNSTNESFTTACTTTCVKLLHSVTRSIYIGLWYGWILLKNTFVTLPSGLFSC